MAANKTSKRQRLGEGLGRAVDVDLVADFGREKRMRKLREAWLEDQFSGGDGVRLVKRDD